MWSVIAAEWRQWVRFQVGALVIGVTFLVLAFVIESDKTSLHGQPMGVPDARTLFVWMFFCAAPLLIGWYWNLSSNRNSTFRLVDTLPLSRSGRELARLLSLLIQLAPVLIVWLLHYLVLHHLGRAITPWLAVGLLFFVLFWAVGALCHRLFWVGMWATIVLTVMVNMLDRWETRLSLPTTVSAAWTALVFAVLTAGLGWWMVSRSNRDESKLSPARRS